MAREIVEATKCASARGRQRSGHRSKYRSRAGPRAPRSTLAAAHICEHSVFERSIVKVVFCTCRKKQATVKSFEFILWIPSVVYVYPVDHVTPPLSASHSSVTEAALSLRLPRCVSTGPVVVCLAGRAKDRDRDGAIGNAVLGLQRLSLASQWPSALRDPPRDPSLQRPA